MVLWKSMFSKWWDQLYFNLCLPAQDTFQVKIYVSRKNGSYRLKCMTHTTKKFPAVWVYPLTKRTCLSGIAISCSPTVICESRKSMIHLCKLLLCISSQGISVNITHQHVSEYFIITNTSA